MFRKRYSGRRSSYRSRGRSSFRGRRSYGGRRSYRGRGRSATRRFSIAGQRY